MKARRSLIGIQFYVANVVSSVIYNQPARRASYTAGWAETEAAWPMVMPQGRWFNLCLLTVDATCSMLYALPMQGVGSKLKSGRMSYGLVFRRRNWLHCDFPGLQSPPATPTARNVRVQCQLTTGRNASPLRVPRSSNCTKAEQRRLRPA